MKLLFSLGLALALSAAAHAQVFRPSGSGGHERSDSRRSEVSHRGWDHHRHHGRFHGPRFGAVLYPGGYGYGRYYAAPVFGYYDGYSRHDYPYYSVGTGYGYYGSGSAASNGLVLGALAGGIVGHNRGEFRHNGWRGAAWGAGLGWLLGSVVEANRRLVAAPVVYSYPQAENLTLPVASAPAPVSAPPPAPAQPITIINNYYGNAAPMSGANALFGR
jgi:hypothetical protein